MGQLAVNGGTPVWSKNWPTWPIYSQREVELLRQVLESGDWAYDGPFEAQFQRDFADYQTARYGICVTSGTIGLQLALEALDIGVGDEVILPANTWQATAVAVLDVNAVPILVDVEPESSHACEYETSLYLALKPELVEMSKAVDERAPLPPSFQTDLLAGTHPQGSAANLNIYWSARTASGIMGDATKASKEKGEQFLTAAVEGLIELIREYRQAPILPRRDQHP